MYSLNPIQERKSQILKGIVDTFHNPNVMIIETPDNPIIEHRGFVSDNIVKSMVDNLEKGMGGEGSKGGKGGKIIGHTASGKPIYDTMHAKEHKGFTPEDHRDAADLFHSHALSGGLQQRRMKTRRDEHHTLAEKGGNSLKDWENKKINGGKTTKETTTGKQHPLQDKIPHNGGNITKAKYRGEDKSGTHSYEIDTDEGNEYKIHVDKEKHNATKKLETVSKSDKKDIKKGFEDELNNDTILDRYGADDQDMMRKGEVLDKLGMGYGGNNAFTLTKTGKELKEILPGTIATLNAKKAALEATMETLMSTAGCDPTEVYASYNVKSISCKRYPYDSIRVYDEMSRKYSDLTDEQKAMQTYNDACFAWQSISEDIVTCKVINKNLDDSKKYILTVSQLIALATGDDDLMKAVEDNLEKGGPGKQVTRGTHGIMHKSIEINPKNEGKFDATKKKTGETTEELTHSKNKLTRERAVFAENASHWKHPKKKKDESEDEVEKAFNDILG